MKKLLMIVTLVFVILTAVSCSKETASETAADSPMSMLSKDEDFLNQLGFGIDTTVIPVRGMTRFVINGKVAQLRFALERADGTPIDVNFRATKDDGQKESLCDVYGTKSDPVSLNAAGLSVIQTMVEKDGITYYSYYFEKDGVYCCVTLSGEPTQEELETVIGAFKDALIIQKN